MSLQKKVMYKVPFVDYPAHYFSMKAEIDAAIKEVLSRGDFILRDHLRRFEGDFASYLGVKHAVGVNSGTDALFFSLLTAGVGQGDEVVTVAHTFVATLAAIVHCGATLVLADVGEDMNMDMQQLDHLITPKTKAIIPVHLNGRLCDMDRVMSVADEHDLVVVEDAAQALGAMFDNKKGGTFGLTGCFSFYPAKILGTCGDGGMVVTDDDEVADKLRALRDNGRTVTGDLNGYGYNSRLDNLHAAILNVKLKRVPAWISRRRELANLYHEGLSDLTQLKLPPPTEPKSRFFDVYQNYVIRSRERDMLAAHLRERGVEILISWPKPLHHQESLNLGHLHLPKTEQVSNEVLSLPLYPELSDEKATYIIKSIHDFYV